MQYLGAVPLLKAVGKSDKVKRAGPGTRMPGFEFRDNLLNLLEQFPYL